MIHPSYSELIDAINAGNEEGAENVILNSRYSLVLATSKRARQLIDGARPLVAGAKDKKPLSVAIDELYKGKVKILTSDGEVDEETLVLSEDAAEEALTEKEPTETQEAPEAEAAESAAEAESEAIPEEAPAESEDAPAENE